MSVAYLSTSGSESALASIHTVTAGAAVRSAREPWVRVTAVSHAVRSAATGETGFETWCSCVRSHTEAGSLRRGGVGPLVWPSLLASLMLTTLRRARSCEHTHERLVYATAAKTCTLSGTAPETAVSVAPCTLTS